MPRKKTQEEFLAELEKHHKNKYELVGQFTSMTSKVLLLCKTHGEFDFWPANLRAGRGCPQCGREAGHEKQKVGTELFVKQAKEVHGNKYEYSKVEYTHARNPVEIICPEHGSFMQSPNAHRRGAGCPACNMVEKGATVNHFLIRAAEKHGDKYDYSLVEYKNSYTKVRIVCKEHGVFSQEPAKHTEGAGCPQCAVCGFNITYPAILYLFQCTNEAGAFTGYGITGNHRKRFQQHRKNLRDQAFTITKQQVYHFSLGSYAKELEDMLYAEYPDPSSIGSSVPGFKRESTDTPFAQVKEFIEQKIKENSLRWGLLE